MMKDCDWTVLKSVAVAGICVAAVWAAPAAAKDLGTMFGKLSTGLEKVPLAIQLLMWALGLALIIVGGMLLRRAGQSREQSSAGGWWTLGIGVMFALGPHTLGFFASSLGFDATPGQPSWGS